jgi:hypothetical protein
MIAFAAVAVALFSIPPYLTYDADASRMPLDPANPQHFLWVTLHAFPGVLALIIGPFQFATAVRRRHPRVHRMLGRIYLLSVLFGSIMAIPAALASTSGLAAQVAFLLLAGGWV